MPSTPPVGSAFSHCMYSGRSCGSGPRCTGRTVAGALAMASQRKTMSCAWSNRLSTCSNALPGSKARPTYPPNRTRVSEHGSATYIDLHRYLCGPVQDFPHPAEQMDRAYSCAGRHCVDRRTDLHDELQPPLFGSGAFIFRLHAGDPRRHRAGHRGARAGQPAAQERRCVVSHRPAALREPSEIPQGPIGLGPGRCVARQ
ncbi:hypothetical protein D3C76_1070680 [compost metagenome]